MKQKTFPTVGLVALVIMLMGAGCAEIKNTDNQIQEQTSNEQYVGDTSEQEVSKKNMDKTSMNEDAPETMMNHGAYVAYNDTTLDSLGENGAVLFFHAQWCPTCKAADNAIADQEENIPENLTIVKVDYDTQTELKKQYGVTTQHTFVQVDQNGELTKKWLGSRSVAEVVAQIQ